MDVILVYFIPHSQKKSIVVYNKKKRNNNSFFESVIDNDHLIPNPIVSPLAIQSKISLFWINISRTNIFLPSKKFYDSKKEKDFLKSPNIL